MNGEKLKNDLPIMGDVGVIGLVPDEWTGTWQPRHHVLMRLAKYFNVVWIDPAKGWRDLWLHSTHQQRRDSEQIMPAFSVYRPGRFLPQLYKPRLAALMTERIRYRQAVNILKKRGCSSTILYVWRPQFGHVLDLIDHDLSCYHIDDEYTFSDVETPIGEDEAKLLSRADQVFIHSPGLMKKKGHLNAHTMIVPNGVDYHAYADPCDEPEDLKHIPRPRIGYTGVLKKQLNWDLLVRLSAEHKDWSFVLVGPVASHSEIAPAVEELSRRSNVHFLGSKSVLDLAAYPQHFDVCVMPYRITDYTNHIYPLKLHEYLAGGKPVVGTPIRSLLDFPGIVALAADADEWSAALAAALAPVEQLPTRTQERQAVARQHDWNKLVKGIAETICTRLGPAYEERFEKSFRQAETD